MGDSGGGCKRTAIAAAAELLRLWFGELKCSRIKGADARECDDDREVASDPDTSSAAGGDGGKLVRGGEWNGASVGEMYRSEEGPAASLDPASSSMGVIGGGGVRGISGVSALFRSGDDKGGTDCDGFGRRDR